MGWLISLPIRFAIKIAVLFIAGFIMVTVCFVTVCSVVFRMAVEAFSGVFGGVFDLPAFLMVLALAIVFSVVAYLIEKRKRANLIPCRNLPNRRV